MNTSGRFRLPAGRYRAAGRFCVNPWRPVPAGMDSGTARVSRHRHTRAAAVGDSVALIVVAAVAQVVLTARSRIAVLLALLKGRDGAIGAAGFIGFGLGAMPIGLAAMKRLALKCGDAPRAFLVITLAVLLFTDTANALIVQAFLTWFGNWRLGRSTGCAILPSAFTHSNVPPPPGPRPAARHR